MSTRSCQLLLNVSLVIGSLLFGIILVEGSMYLMRLDYALVSQPDPRLGWRHVPGARKLWTDEGRGLVEINNLGNRDRERSLENPSGAVRIAVFGDSMTEAFQVDLDQTFTHLLEEGLGKFGERVEVLNFGVSGYSPIQELLHFKQEGPLYHPHLVILAVFLDNDIRDCHPNLSVSLGEPPFITIDGEATHFDLSRPNQSFRHYHRQPFSWLRNHSRIYRLISTWRWRLEGQARDKVLTSEKVPERYLVYQKTLQPEWEQAWTLFERAILEFAAEARQQQAQFVILSVPSPLVVSNEAWLNTVAAYPSIIQLDWNLEGPEDRLSLFTREHNIPLIQPYKEFRQASKGPPLYWNNVGHFTPYGHQLMAKILQDFLRGSKLLPHHKWKNNTALGA